MIKDRLDNNDFKPWSPFPEVLDYVESLSRSLTKILDVGAGQTPFPSATHVVDMMPRSFPGIECHKANFRLKLPFEDKSFDFIYSRHTIEDLDDPTLLISEIQRIGKSGYIETPSPLSEVCRGIDGGSPAWRGYNHHRHFVWVEDGALCILPKLAKIEYTELPDAQYVDFLIREPMLANTYFFWSDEFKVRIIWDEILENYEKGVQGKSWEEWVMHAVKEGALHSLETINRLKSFSAGTTAVL